MKQTAWLVFELCCVFEFVPVAPFGVAKGRHAVFFDSCCSLLIFGMVSICRIGFWVFVSSVCLGVFVRSMSFMKTKYNTFRNAPAIMVHSIHLIRLDFSTVVSM